MKYSVTKEQAKEMAVDRVKLRDAILTIQGAFRWYESVEGFDFWSDVMDRLEAIERGANAAYEASESDEDKDRARMQ